MAITDYYINSDGKQVYPAKMTDPHLLNAFAKYKKRVSLLENDVKAGGGQRWFWQYLEELRRIKKMLYEEIQARGLTDL